MVAMIEVKDLSKTFKNDIKAVKGISFQVEKGEFFAFLGPNGAGKSTTIQMITTLLNPTSGEVSVAGFNALTNPEKVRKEIGVALQETGIDPALKGRELLELQARLFGYKRNDARKRAAELLELVDLTSEADRPCGKYSGGMRRRLDLALTLVQRPKILFLDEPTTGLDPVNRKIIWEEIRYLNKEIGTTIFLTTQYLEEADQLADHIAIINNGEIAASGTPEELKDLAGQDVVQMVFSTPEEAETAKIQLQEKASETICDGNELKLFLPEATSRLPELIRRLDDTGMVITELNVSKPTLDDVFIQVTGTVFEKGKAEEAHQQ